MTLTLAKPTLDAIESPFWQFDRRLGRYRDKSTGRFLSQSNLEKLQRQHIALVERDINQVGELLLKGQLSLRSWQEATSQSIKTLHLHQAALGRGGIKQMSPNDWLAAGREIRSQYSYLKTFAIDLQRGYSIGKNGQQVPMTIARFRARLSLYAKSGRVSYEQGKQEVAKSQGNVFMQRFVNSAHPCSDCPRYSAMGVQPIGVLPMPGQACQCRANCLCRVKYFATLEEAIRESRHVRTI